MKTQTTGKSPYVKYGKVPYKYSTIYNDWQSARKRGDEGETRRLAELHTQRYLHSPTGTSNNDNEVSPIRRMPREAA